SGPMFQKSHDSPAVWLICVCVCVCVCVLDCAREGRHFCEPGSSHCGPCLLPLVEDNRGRCVVRRRSHFSKYPPSSRLDTQPSTCLHSHSSTRLDTQPSTKRVGAAAAKKCLLVTGLCLMLGSVALVLAAVCWVRMQRATRLAQKADYSAFGVLNHHSYDVTSSGDKTLAQSAQMYHYQHQKQQMLSQRDEPKIPESGATSDEENEDGDFTVYECPGLAPTGEMEVKNPLFDDSTLHLHLNLQRSYN
uniref:Neural proliferation, differentiation and control, 1b n=1 Tax=Electrophorus electricus TaxID=8005 RepID=A0A4W4GT53_ELEEL